MERASLSPASIGLIEAIRHFSQLPEPERLPVGDYHAVLLGPAWFRAFASLGLALAGLPRWIGKRFAADGSGVNLLRAVDGIGLDAAVLPMASRLAASPHDGRRVVRVGYDAGSRFPWPAVVDELRPWPQGGADAWIGMARSDWRLTRGIALLRLPFLLLRSD